MPPRADRAPASQARGVAVSEKVCCGCGDSKPHSEFLPSKFTPDGVTELLPQVHVRASQAGPRGT